MTAQAHFLASVSQPIVIALLGGFTVTINDQAKVRFRTNKTRALLAYLLLAPLQPLLRTALSALFWPDYTLPSAQTNLRQALANLRDVFAPVELFHADRTYVHVLLDPATVWCDARQFHERLAACQQHNHPTLRQCAACQTRLQQAVALYKGVLLENFPDVDSPPFREWLQTQRADFADRLAEAKAALAAPVVRMGNLLPPLTPLIGRAHELAEVTQHLHHTVYRCVSLVGQGGIGKTRLACAVGEQLQAHVADGVWLVELGALAPTTAAEASEQLHNRLATAIAAALRLTFYGTTPPTTQVANYLSNKTALLILDGFEHLAAGATWLSTLLIAAPQLRLLITTRHRLPLQSQLVYQVGGLEVPGAQPTTGSLAAHLIAQYASVQLFVERAESAQLPLPLDASTLAVISQLCRFVDGSPWAIELAVSMLDRYTPAALLAALQGNYRTLTTTLLDLPARQRSAEAVFLTTWQLLTGEEAQTLARCSVFRGGFTLDAAQTVAIATPATLEALVQKSLLLHSAAERYTMHDLVRQFAGEQLMHAAAHQNHAAHAAYFTALLATWQPDDATIHRFRTAVTQDWENVQAAWGWGVDTGAINLMQQGVGGLAEYYNLVELFLEADTTLGNAILQVRQRLANADAAPTAARRALQTLLAHLLWRHCYFINDALTETGRGAPLARELLTLAHELGDGALAARGYYELSIVAYLQGDNQSQQEMLLEALPLAQHDGTRYDQIVCLNMLGLARDRQGDLVTALAYYRQALALTQGGNYAHYDLMVLNNIGSVLVSDGQFSAAIANFQQALPHAMRAGFNSKIAFIIANLGEVAYLVGDYAEARLRLFEAQQRYADLHDYRLEAEILNLLAKLFAELGDDVSALAYCQRSLASAAGQVYTVQHAALCTIGHLYRRQGKWAAAADIYQQALTLSQDVHWATNELLCQTHLAAVALDRGDADVALAMVEPLLAHFAVTPFVAQQRPQELFLIAYEILVANANPRAHAVLHQAWAYVQEQAAKIDDPRLRQTFLTNVPVNRVLARLVGEG